MKKIIKNTTIFGLIVFLFSAALFCCCLTGSAQAGIQFNNESSSGNESHCCPDKTKNSDSKNDHECKCEKNAEILTIKAFNLSKVVGSLGQLLDGTLSFAGKVNVSDHTFTQNHILRASAQLVKSDPSIYLQDSVLRL